MQNQIFSRKNGNGRPLRLVRSNNRTVEEQRRRFLDYFKLN